MWRARPGEPGLRGGRAHDRRRRPGVPPFAFDADQLTQVLWNVAINGMQAMDGCGELRIDVGRDNGEVVIAVSDTGRGILPRTASACSSPSTRRSEVGRGSG